MLTCTLTLVSLLIMNPESGALLYMAYRIPEVVSKFGRREQIWIWGLWLLGMSTYKNDTLPKCPAVKTYCSVLVFIQLALTVFIIDLTSIKQDGSLGLLPHFKPPLNSPHDPGAKQFGSRVRREKWVQGSWGSKEPCFWTCLLVLFPILCLVFLSILLYIQVWVPHQVPSCWALGLSRAS